MSDVADEMPGWASDQRWAHLLAPDVRDALVRHGYDPTALPSGVIGPPRVWKGMNGVLLRTRVCVLDGVEIDGHGSSDLDPGGGCMYCGHGDGSEDDRG